MGIILVGTGVAFNAAAALGNDPVGIVYDGIRSALNLSSEQLGMASNIVNIVLVVIIFFWERHYVNIGTFIYIIPYGFVVDLGGRLYHMLFKVQTLPVQIAGAAIGCFLLYMGGCNVHYGGCRTRSVYRICNDNQRQGEQTVPCSKGMF